MVPAIAHAAQPEDVLRSPVLPGLTELTAGVERVASNHQGVDFAGAIEDLEGLAVPEESLHPAAVVDT